jgi:hypothetical protein
VTAFDETWLLNLPKNAQEKFRPLIAGNPLKKLDSKKQMKIKASQTKAP